MWVVYGWVCLATQKLIYKDLFIYNIISYILFKWEENWSHLYDAHINNNNSSIYKPYMKYLNYGCLVERTF